METTRKNLLLILLLLTISFVIAARSDSFLENTNESKSSTNNVYRGRWKCRNIWKRICRGRLFWRRCHSYVHHKRCCRKVKRCNRRHCITHTKCKNFSKKHNFRYHGNRKRVFTYRWKCHSFSKRRCMRSVFSRRKICFRLRHKRCCRRIKVCYGRNCKSHFQCKTFR